MSRRYRNPPVEEAVCEFRFAPEDNWDLTVPGKLQVALGAEYSGAPREQQAIRVELDMAEETSPNLRYGKGPVRVQLPTADGTRIVAVGPDALSIHTLRPYQGSGSLERGGWAEFEPRIFAALDAYWKVSQPDGVRRVGLRYINRIVTPKGDMEVERYLLSALPKVKALPAERVGFLNRVEYVYDDGTRLVLSQASVDTPEDRPGFILDIDANRESAEPFGQDEVLDRVGELHARIEAVFESIITDKARRIFGVA